MRLNYFKNTRSKMGKGPKYTITDFARLIGIPVATLRARMEKTDRPPRPVFTDKRRIYYSLEDLHQWHKDYTNKDTENSNA